MSMDAARARFPECLFCGRGVDEDDEQDSYFIVKGEYYHAKCWRDFKLSEQDAEDYSRSLDAELP